MKICIFIGFISVALSSFNNRKFCSAVGCCLAALFTLTNSIVRHTRMKKVILIGASVNFNSKVVDFRIEIHIFTGEIV